MNGRKVTKVEVQTLNSNNAPWKSDGIFVQDSPGGKIKALYIK